MDQIVERPTKRPDPDRQSIDDVLALGSAHVTELALSASTGHANVVSLLPAKCTQSP